MNGTSDDVTPAPMEGNGAYNRSSGVQAAGSMPAVALLQQAARAVPLPPPSQPVNIADYGASEGRNSMRPMALAISALRERAGQVQPVVVNHTDLPGNDFTALFQTLATDPDSYLRHDDAAFATAIGRSYFEQILPLGSVTLGWSSWAIQWLSRTPAAIPDQVQVAFSRDPAARTAYARQAAADWKLFLTMRSRELCPGGRLVVLTMAVDDGGDFGYRPLLDAIYGALGALVDSGFMRADELQRMAIPTVGRSKAQFAEPFANGGCFEDLAIEQMEVFYGEDRIWAQFAANGDAPSFGAQWAAFSRASVFPTLAASLDGGAHDPRLAAFHDRLEEAVAARMAMAPAPMTIPLAQMLFVKGQATSP